MTYRDPRDEVITRLREENAELRGKLEAIRLAGERKGPKRSWSLGFLGLFGGSKCFACAAPMKTYLLQLAHKCNHYDTEHLHCPCDCGALNCFEFSGDGLP